MIHEVVQRLDRPLCRLLTYCKRQRARLELIQDLSEYTGLPVEEVQKRIMSEPAKVSAHEWKKMNPKSHEEILDFYRETESYLFDMAHYDYFIETWRESAKALQGACLGLWRMNRGYDN